MLLPASITANSELNACDPNLDADFLKYVDILVFISANLHPLLQFPDLESFNITLC